MRREYLLGELHFKNLIDDPIVQLALWLTQMEQLNIPDYNAMILATTNKEGRPSNRTVLLQDWDEKGIIFVTNYLSRKGQDLEEKPYASAVFFWKEYERQAIVEGKVEKLAENESDKLFNNRPRGSQIGAWASKQDTPLPCRKTLDNDYQDFLKKFEGKKVPRPDYWGGYRLIPERAEFWQGRENRLHDRFVYIRKEEGWHIERLSP